MSGLGLGSRGTSSSQLAQSFRTSTPCVTRSATLLSCEHDRTTNKMRESVMSDEWIEDKKLHLHAVHNNNMTHLCSIPDWV